MILNKTEQQKLELWERKMLRRIYGGIKVGEIWLRRSNRKAYELYNCPIIIDQFNHKKLDG